MRALPTRRHGSRLHPFAQPRCMIDPVQVLFVVDHPQQWPFAIPGSTVASAREYLTDPGRGSGERPRVVNLCRASRYQGRGYYVSLLAEARGHRPLPDVKAIEDLQVQAQQQTLAKDLEPLARSIRHEASDLFELDAYFGGDPAGLHAELAAQLFAIVRAPLVRAHFRRVEGAWKLDRTAAIGLADVSAQHRAFLLSAATEFVNGGRERARAPAAPGELPKIGILCDPRVEDRPSNDKAIRKFIEAAPLVGLQAEVIGPGDIERLGEFDGLFIRTTTNVGHYTYEFSRRAESQGLVVIDDPDSILKCTNKVYLNELMQRHRIATPRTMMVHRGNVKDVVPALGLPCILKQPDGGFGVGVVKIESEEQLADEAARLLAGSELLVAQQWLPTDFDWRVCVFDRRPLFVCKYFMARGHWQIVKHGPDATVEGETLALSVGEAPENVVATALRACNLIGSGLYGVDLKQAGGQCFLIEINDNPNVDAGNEDRVLGAALYREVMGVFARRIAERGRAGSGT
jgi:glutathione synthase/RimK-type ligase-like ATP-grasp enzyme